MAEQTCQETLDSLRECLHCRWDSTQPEEPRQTTRMPAAAEYHTQTQAISEHFCCYQDHQQESREEALRVVRDAHCQALAAMAMLEGHIEQLGMTEEQRAIQQSMAFRKQEMFLEWKI